MGRALVLGFVAVAMLAGVACGETEDGDAEGASSGSGGTAAESNNGGALSAGNSFAGRPAGSDSGGARSSEAGRGSGGRAGSRATPEPTVGGSGGAAGASVGDAGAPSAGAGAPSAGAGGEPSSPAACMLEPCGGDPVGIWEVAGVCREPTFELPAMPGCAPELRDLSVDVTGTVEIRDDGTYSFDQVMSYELRVFYPTACGGENVDDPELTCALIRQVVEAQSGSALCVAELTGCACEVLVSQASARSGDYGISGDRLTIDGDSVSEFCVEGDELMLHELQNDATVAYRRSTVR